MSEEKEMKTVLKRGNIVRFKCGFWGDENASETNKLGVIESSYGEKYGDGTIYGGYIVLDKETGSSSCWWEEDYLEFVSEGGENEIIKCKEIYNNIKNRDKDLNYIKEQFLKNDLGLSSTSILTLFHEIGFTSSFERNGEYYCLWHDWYALCPIFVAIFNKDYDGMIAELSIFKEEVINKYEKKVIDFYNKVNT